MSFSSVLSFARRKPRHSCRCPGLKAKWVVFGVALVPVAASVADATPISNVVDADSNGTIDLQDLIDSGTTGFTVGDKHFYDFSYTPTGTSVPTASQITVGLAPGTDYGLRFGFGWFSLNGINVDSRIDYRVDVTDPNPAVAIDGINLDYNGVAQNNAEALVAETVDTLAGKQLALLAVTPGDSQVTVPINPIQRSLLIDKDIQLFSAPTATMVNNYSAISFVDNSFSQTAPEPGPMALIGLAVYGLLLRRRRRP